MSTPAPLPAPSVKPSAVKSPLEVLGAELGAIAAQIDRETRLRLDAGLADIRRATSEFELRFERLERGLLDRLAAIEPAAGNVPAPAKADKPRVRVPAGSARP